MANKHPPSCEENANEKSTENHFTPTGMVIVKETMTPSARDDISSDRPVNLCTHYGNQKRCYKKIKTGTNI